MSALGIVILISQSCGYQVAESSPLKSLKYLARHQDQDGSWGRLPDRCSCVDMPLDTPLRISADADTRERIRAHIENLGREDIEERIQAEKAILEFGLRAVPQLQVALGSADSEVRLRSRTLLERWWQTDDEVKKLCREAANLRSKGDVQTTGLALLCFLGAGYSHLSKDEHIDPIDGRTRLHFGQVVKQGSRWLIDRQDKRGAFDAGDSVANAIAALAITELYGLTASAWLKEPAQRAYDFVRKDRTEDTRILAWKVMVLGSAETADLQVDRKDDPVREYRLTSDKKDVLSRSASFLLKWKRLKIRDPALARELCKLPMDLPPEEFLFATLGIFHSGGLDSSSWKKWVEGVKERLIPTQQVENYRCCRGSWESHDPVDQLRMTALLSLTLLFYYRYSNHFGLYGWPS